MRKGKIAAQAAHASMGILLNMCEETEDPYFKINFFRFGVERDSAFHKWLTGRFTKICVYVDCESDLLDIYQKAHQAKLPCSLIRDAGLTEFGGVPTYTCVGIGPAEPEKIDQITGHLPLY